MFRAIRHHYVRDGLKPVSRIRVMAWPAFANRTENPYNALLYSALQEIGVEVAEFSVTRLLFGPRCDVLHLHWAPTNRVRGRTRGRTRRTSTELLLLLKVAELRGMKVVWTAHNLGAHDELDHPDLESAYWRRIARHLGALISLSHSGIELLRSRYPALESVPSFVTAHGEYRGAYPRTLNRTQARAHLGIQESARVITFIGQIRPYKNLPVLLRAFASIPDPNAVLLIAGKVKLDDKKSELDELVSADPRVRLIGDFIPAVDLQIYLHAADLVVLPFRETLNSGSAILALSFDKPVLVPRYGSLIDLAKDVGEQWVMTYDGELTTERLAQSLDAALALDGEVAPLASLDWARIAEQTRDIYRSLLV